MIRIKFERGLISMITKIAVFIVFTAIFYFSAAAYAQDFGRPMTSADALNTADTSNDTIVVISKEETEIPGYVHEKYAFVDQHCGGAQIVDYYGPAIDPNDPSIHKLENRVCTDLDLNKLDGD
jgi:hypothetical protein